ncbi:response regulator [Halobacteriovorax marinus]|uniref:response regulator n=1 Tax=Halobacteriovorax marinus TaxID=97084 RepID=UPI003A8E78E0
MKNILIVDDEPQIIELLSDIIGTKFNNLNILNAPDGLEAYVKSCNLKFDLIITDHKMPFCTGLDFIRKMRETNNINSDSPIIVVSGFIPEIEDKISTLDNLFYLDKPLKTERLLKYCKMILNSK